MSDVLLFGGTILTMNERHPEGTVLAIRDDRVQAVGGDELFSFRRDCTELIDLQGKTACPGFVDAHHHIALAAWYERGVDLAGCRSAAEALGKIKAQSDRDCTGRVSNLHDENWLYAFNYRPRNFRDGSAITRYDLDRAAGGRPTILVHFSFHEAIISSSGLRLTGLSRSSRDPLGGRIVRDRHGEPTGELWETAVGRIEAQARSSAAVTGYQDWLQALQRYCRGLFAAGITHVCDPGVDGMLEDYLRRAQGQGQLPVPVSMLFACASGLFQPPTDRLSGPVTGETLDGLGVGALKIFADGGSRCAVCVGLREAVSAAVALVGRSARMRRPALLMNVASPGTPHLERDGQLHFGYLHYLPEQLASLCRNAHNRGFQIAVHAACNAGIESVLNAYECLPQGTYRHRIEHLVSLDEKQARRIAGIGALGVVQPGYVAQFGDEWESMPTPTRLRSIPLRTLLDTGVTLAGSSDAPIVPYDPLYGMATAITRRTSTGQTHQVEQSITALEALRMWTTGAALAANLSGTIGVLAPGARADVVVLSENPLNVPHDSFDRVRVVRTLLGGRTVFFSNEFGRETQTASWVG